MTDLINQQLSRVAVREKNSIEALQRYFKMHFKISLSREALLNRLKSLNQR